MSYCFYSSPAIFEAVHVTYLYRRVKSVLFAPVWGPGGKKDTIKQVNYGIIL